MAASDTERSDQTTGGPGRTEEVALGNGEQSRTGLAKKLNTPGVHGIMGQKI